MSSEDIGTIKTETESLNENQNSKSFSEVNEVIIKDEPIESASSKNDISVANPIYVLSSEIKLKEEPNETQNEETTEKNVPKVGNNQTIKLIFGGPSIESTIESIYRDSLALTASKSDSPVVNVIDQSESKMYKESEKIKTIYRESLGM